MREFSSAPRSTRSKRSHSAEVLYSKALRLAHSAGSPERVLHLLNGALEAGSGDAAYALATWYLHGKPPLVSRNLRKALALFRVAAKAGVASALYELAVCYQQGEGVKRDAGRAFQYYLQAALKGDADAVVEVARCFKYGYGIERNSAASRVFLKRAAELDQ